MLVLRTTNFQVATFRSVVLRQNHFVVFIVHRDYIFFHVPVQNHMELMSTCLHEN